MGRVWQAKTRVRQGGEWQGMDGSGVLGSGGACQGADCQGLDCSAEAWHGSAPRLAERPPLRPYDPDTVDAMLRGWARDGIPSLGIGGAS